MCFFVGVFFVGSKKKNKSRRQTHTKTQEFCSEFQGRFFEAKKAKKGEKRRKRISLPRTFI